MSGFDVIKGFVPTEEEETALAQLLEADEKAKEEELENLSKIGESDVTSGGKYTGGVRELFASQLKSPNVSNSSASGGGGGIQESCDAESIDELTTKINKRIEIMDFLIVKYQVLNELFKNYKDLFKKFAAKQSSMPTILQCDFLNKFINTINGVFSNNVNLKTVYYSLKKKVIDHANASTKPHAIKELINKTLSPTSEMSVDTFNFIKNYMEINKINNLLGGKPNRKKTRKSRRQKHHRKSRRR